MNIHDHVKLQSLIQVLHLLPLELFEIFLDQIYQKYESDLSIDDSAKQKSKIKELEKEHEEVKDLKLRLEMMEKILAENNLTSLKTYDLAYPEAHKEHLKLLKKLESGEIQEK